MENGSVQTQLSRFLLSYRTSPHSTTRVPPAELLMQWRLHTQLNQLVPSIADCIGNKQQSQQKAAHDYVAKGREILEGQAVYGMVFWYNKAWMPGSSAGQLDSHPVASRLCSKLLE